MTGHRRPLSDREKATIVKLWPDPNLSVRQIAERLCGRSTAWVAYHAQKTLGLGSKPTNLNEWTEAKIEELKRLWPDPNYSGREIGRVVGMTKNSVISKAYKLGLPDRRGLIRPGPKPAFATSVCNLSIAVNLRNTVKRIKAEKAKGPDALPPAKPHPFKTTPLAASTPMTLAQMPGSGAGLCRWPVGPDPAQGQMDEQLFCCATSVEDHRYCAHHLQRSCAKTRSPEQRAADKARAEKMKAHFARADKPNVHARLYARKAA